MIRRPTLLMFIGVAAAYATGGYLGLKLAIPPGFASAVFPAAGIALAAVFVFGPSMLPAIFAGSFLLNLYVGTDGLTSVQFASLYVPVTIGAGAAIQSYVAVGLIHRFVGRDSDLDDRKELAIFQFVGGPVACLIAPSIGASVLLDTGVISGSEYWVNWFNWWVGDTIGVFVFGPLSYLVLVPSHSAWRNNRLLPILSYVLLFFGVTLVYAYISGLLNERADQGFRSHAKHMEILLRDSAALETAVVQDLKAFFDSTDHVDRRQFKIYTDNVLSRRLSIQALEWCPKVLPSEVTHYTQLTQVDGYPTYAMWQLGTDNIGEPVAGREVYFPIMYLNPHESNEQAFGYDPSSNPVANQAIQAAIRTGEPAASGPVRLIQETGVQKGVILYQAVYQSGGETKNLENLKGLVLAVMRMDDFLAETIAPILDSNVNVVLVDTTDPDQLQVVGTHPPGPGSKIEDGAEKLHDLKNRRFSYIADLEIGGRKWQTIFVANDDYAQTHKDLTAWVVLVFGLLFTGLFGGLMMSEVGRKRFVSTLVDRRTHELRDANRQLFLATEIKTQFLANMSHEIRTPMNGVIGLSQLLLLEDLSPRARELVENILQSGEDLLGIINDILDVSKLETGHVALNPDVVDLRRLLTRVGVLLRLRAEEKGLVFKTSVADDVPSLVVADDVRIKQVLVNLIGNAVKFTDSGSVDAGITVVSLEPNTCRLRFSVVDTGIGVRSDDIDELTRPFAQAQHTRGGTGLGLSISSQLLDLMGSKLEIEGGPEGSVFSFEIELPVADDGPQPKDAEVGVEQIKANQDLGQRFPVRILIVDDHQINRDLAVGLLAAVGYQTETATNGREAVELHAEHAFDIILMDVQMPVLDGIEATREIRANPDLSQPFVIAITANAFAETRLACLEAGMNDFISKPVNAAELFTALRRGIGDAENDGDEKTTHSIALDIKSVPEDKLLDLNRRRFDSLSAVDIDLARTTLQSFVDRSNGLMDALADGVTRNDKDATVRSAHQFKGLAGTVGAEKLADLLQQVESAAETAGPVSIASQIEDVSAIMADAIKAIRELLAETGGSDDC